MVAVSGEVDVHATPAEILDVIADLAQYPQWSSVHKSAAVDKRYPDGHPQRATMAVSAAGLVDEQVVDYTWSEHGVSWTLVKPTRQQRNQQGRYTITPRERGVSHVRYELDISPAIPVPGLVLRRVMRSAVVAATDGLRDRVESL
jgi:ribosome-associated toxin RatA of RatAB toxin-antitoxin module